MVCVRERGLLGRRTESFLLLFPERGPPPPLFSSFEPLWQFSFLLLLLSFSSFAFLFSSSTSHSILLPPRLPRMQKKNSPLQSRLKWEKKKVSPSFFLFLAIILTSSKEKKERAVGGFPEPMGRHHFPFFPFGKITDFCNIVHAAIRLA